jgi:hypothetical protein
MTKILLAVERRNETDTHNLQLGTTGRSTLPEGAQRVHATAWVVEIPKCASFLATLIQNAERMARPYVYAELQDASEVTVFPKV